MAVNEFKTDTHRRVAGMLMRPRSAAEIAAEFAKHDPHVAGDMPLRNPLTGEVSEATGAYTVEGVTEYLEDLEAEGLAVNLGTFDSSKKALDVQDEHEEAINFTGSRKSFKDLSESSDKFPYLNSADHWVRTEAAQARLVGPAPGQEDS